MGTNQFILWRVFSVLLIFYLVTETRSQSFPYTFRLKSREWIIGEDESVGARISGIVPTGFGGPTTSGNVTFVFEKGPNGDVDLSGYFAVDNGRNIVVKRELKGLSGVSSSIYVVAEGDGLISTKNEAHVQIVKQGEVHGNQGGGDFLTTPPRPVLVPSTTSTTTTPSTTTTAAASTPTTPPATVTSPNAITQSPKTPTTTAPPETTERTTWTSSPWLIIATLLTLATILIATILLYIRHRHRRRNKLPVVKKNTSPSILSQWVGKRAHSNRYEDSSPSSVIPMPTETPPPAASEKKWELPRSSLKIIGMLGEGCFGQVWRCEQTIGDKTITVAVKTLKESVAGERERSDLLSELAVMKTLEPHPNVVKLLGCCTEKDPIFVVMEYVALGKLQTFLRESRDSHYYGNLHCDSNSLSSRDLTNFAYQCSRGMEFLAARGIIHRDLAARNILVDVDRTCKVADFGFARDLVDGDVYERKSDGRLPIRWMAPEALFDNVFTTKTDVWSFGVLMWEIVTLGSTPYPGLGASEVMKRVRDGYRLEKPTHCRRELYNIMFYTWAALPSDRPSFTELTKFLSNLLTTEEDYIQLDQFPEHSYYNFSLATTKEDSQEITSEKI